MRDITVKTYATNSEVFIDGDYYHLSHSAEDMEDQEDGTPAYNNVSEYIQFCIDVGILPDDLSKDEIEVIEMNIGIAIDRYL